MIDPIVRIIASIVFLFADFYLLYKLVDMMGGTLNTGEEWWHYPLLILALASFLLVFMILWLVGR